MAKPKKLGVNLPWGFAYHMREIIQNLRMFTAIFQFFRAPTDEAVGQMFAFNTSFDVVLRKDVPLGVEKI